MKNIFTTLLLSTILLTNGVAQQISATAYNKAIIHEDFSTEGDFFPIVTTAENYFILDKGDYLLSRNNEDSEYAIIANNSSVSNFVLRTAVRIGPSNNKTASVGIIIKAQQDGKGAIIFEINKKGAYRIKQLLGSTYKTLSGSSKQEGWVRNKTINGVDEYNLIEIRTENNIYDVYINSNYLTTFFISDYTSGSCGIIISPETKARINYYYINTKGGNEQSAATYTNENTTSVNTTIEKLNKKIETLEKNNATLNNLNTEARGNQDEEIKNLIQENTDLDAVTIKQEKEIASLQRSITNLESKSSKDVAALTETTTRLNTRNTELASITIAQEKEIKTLSTTLSNLKSKNADATASNKELNDEIRILKQKITLEKSKNTELANDLNTAQNSLKASSAQLKNDINVLNKTVNTLKKEKTTLTADLTKAKNVHKQTKNELSESIKNKSAEINKLTVALNNAKQQLKPVNKISAKLKECATNSANLSTDLKQANNELSALKKIQAQNDEIITNLNVKITDLNSKVDALNNQLSNVNTKLTALNITNVELKELFILKDFEVNGVKPSDLTKQTNTYPTPKELKGNSVIYAVQFGVYMQVQPYSTLKGLDEVWYETTEYGTYVYLSGQFKSPQEATEHKNSLITLGYPNAFVVTLTK